MSVRSTTSRVDSCSGTHLVDPAQDLRYVRATLEALQGNAHALQELLRVFIE
jgi:hypothetical protein